MNRSIFVFLLISITAACSLQPSPVGRNTETPDSHTVATLVDQQQADSVKKVTPTTPDGIPATVTQPAPANLYRVVYAKDDGIWLWDASAPPKKLTSPRQDLAAKIEERDWSPKISDDGQVVVFNRSGELRAINADGSRERTLASASDLATLSHSTTGLASIAWVRQFDFAPHSHDVFLNIQLPTASFPTPEYNLAKVNADSPSLQALLDDSQGGARFVFSPDRTKIALPRNDRINIINADGSGLKTVFTFPAVKMTYSDLSYIPDIVWLPDGSGFKTVIPPHDPAGVPSAPTRFMFISADGTIVAQLAEFVTSSDFVDKFFINFDGSFAHWPFISPNGAKVAYTKTRGDNLELHIIDASTTDQMYFSRPADAFGILGWTPDSSHIAYWQDYRSLIWLGRQSGDAIQLLDVPNVENITWVDEKSYLFVAGVYELRFRALGQPSILLDSGLSEDAFDFILTVSSQ